MRVRGKFVKTQMLNRAFWWLLCSLVCSLGREIFLQTIAKKLGDQYNVGPPNLKDGWTSLSRSLRLLRLWMMMMMMMTAVEQCGPGGAGNKPMRGTNRRDTSSSRRAVGFNPRTTCSQATGFHRQTCRQHTTTSPHHRTDTVWRRGP